MKQLYALRQTFMLAMVIGFLFTEINAQTLVPLQAPSRKQSANQISIGSGDYAPGTVLTGSVPPNSGSKPVLVFIHGYTGDADTWFDGNDMYEKAYYAGYRTAFVTVHPDRSMWVNGELFSRQLQLICNTYGVQKVVVVAHSKGGIDTDAALVHYGAYQRVNRVVTLGTPHFGTPLADLAQSGWVWWLSAIFGQRNEATYVMQTGYMSYYRSITDGKSSNAYTDFRTYGGWKYYGSLWTSGVYLSTNGGASWNGGNDGVVNYKATRRPRGIEMFGTYGDSRTAYNHFDLALGKNVWTYVQNQLPSSLYREDYTAEAVPENYNPVAVVRSNYQILSSEGGTATFQMEEGAESVHLDVRQAQQNEIKLSASGKDITRHQSRRQLRTSDGMLGNYSSQYSLDAGVGQISLTSSEPFVAVLAAEKGGWAELATDLNENKLVYTAGENINLRFYLEDAQGKPVTGATVTGSLRRTANLRGEASAADGEVLQLVFKATGVPGHYSYTSPAINKSGVYNISLQANSPSLNRSLIHSVAVAEPKLVPTAAAPFAVQAWPNPTTQELNLRYHLEEEQQLSFEIYDLSGRMVYQQTQLQPAGTHSLQWSGKESSGVQASPGTYIYRLSGNDKTQNGKFVIIR